MDIVAISGPRIPEDVRSTESGDELKPVQGLVSKLIGEKPETHEDIDKWDIGYKVSISSAARKKFDESNEGNPVRL